MKVWSTKLVLFCNGYLITIKYEHIHLNEYCYNKGLFIKLRQTVLFETLKLGVQSSIDLEIVEPNDK